MERIADTLFDHLVTEDQ